MLDIILESFKKKINFCYSDYNFEILAPFPMNDLVVEIIENTYPYIEE